MPNSTEGRRARGRPRQFEAEIALDRALEVFWRRGLAATSLDELALAMDMRRPSIANAFGDKQALYRAALARFSARMEREVTALLSDEPDVTKALRAFYDRALDVYFSSEPTPGCFVMCTAPVEAVAHPDLRADLKRIIVEIDTVLARRFERARHDGQLSEALDARSAAQLTQAVLHSLAIRARAGASRAELRRLARSAVKLLTR